MKIAVATTDGIAVNEHFGRMENFYIYVITSEGPVKVKEIKVKPLSTGAGNHPFDSQRFQAIAEALKGCDRVYVTKIGERPAAELQKLGIEPIVFDGEIGAIAMD